MASRQGKKSKQSPKSDVPTAEPAYMRPFILNPDLEPLDLYEEMVERLDQIKALSVSAIEGAPGRMNDHLNAAYLQVFQRLAEEAAEIFEKFRPCANRQEGGDNG